MQHVLVNMSYLYFIHCIFLWFLPVLIFFFLLALFYNFMKELLQASSKNEIFSEACPEVRPDGILRILTKGNLNERPQGWTRGEEDQTKEKINT